jgi:hypothetical protein
MSNKRVNKAYVRYDGSGRVIAGSLILSRLKPKVGNWKEIPAYRCCNDNLPSNCIEFVANTTSGGTLFELNISLSSDVTYTVDWGDDTTDSGSLADNDSLNHEFPSLNTAYTVRICFSDASLVTSLEFIGNN